MTEQSSVAVVSQSGATEGTEVKTEVKTEVVAPEKMPKLALDVLGLIAQAQAVHGLRRNVPDYERYAE